MINRLRFKKCLYRMILLRSLIEIKLHKEKMTKLFAFESFVYNLEVCQEEDEKKIITNYKSDGELEDFYEEI